MECTLEGIKYLQFYGIEILPICKQSIFLATTQDDNQNNI